MIKLFVFLVLLLLPSTLLSNELQSSGFRTAEIKVVVNDSDGSPLSKIAVIITPDKISSDPKTQTETINQSDMAFSPYLSVIQAGQAVEFYNNDDITHHIFSASRTQNFSFKIRKGQTNNSIKFLHPAEISMGCNIHDWMSGHLLVVNTPYFSLTNDKGVSNISIFELGEASLRIWHPQMAAEDKQQQKHFLLDGKDLTIEFKLEHALDKIPEQKTEDDLDFLNEYEF